MTEETQPDAPPVLPEFAALLMAHHLSLAAMYWEATDTPAEQLREIIRRTNGNNELAVHAALGWLEAIDTLYEIEGGFGHDNEED